MKTFWHLLSLVFITSCAEPTVQTTDTYRLDREYVREIYLPCLTENYDLNYQLKKLFTPYPNLDGTFDEVLIDKIYNNQMYQGEPEDSRVFFTRNVVNNTLLLNYLQPAPCISSFSVPNPDLYEIFTFELGGSDSLHSFFYFTDTLLYKSNGLVCITSNAEGSYFCDIFINTCGNRNCYPEWLNSGDDDLYSDFKNVKRYEDFDPAWQQYVSKKTEQAADPG
jgi:hypothetical protein